MSTNGVLFGAGGSQPQAPAWQTVPVFISSTFSDMHGERDYLVKRVLPRLRAWCADRRLHLVDIDLRWGITEADAAANRRALEICFRYVDKCRPYFLCFVGQRYGWVPRESEVADETMAGFPGLEKHVARAISVTEMEVRYALARTLEPSARGEKTPQEAFFYLRDPSYLADMPAEPLQRRLYYTDEAVADDDERDLLQRRMTEFREVTIPRSGRPVTHYAAHWTDTETTPELAMPMACLSQQSKTVRAWQDGWERAAGIRCSGTDLRDDAEAAQQAEDYLKLLTGGRLTDFQAAGQDLGEVIFEQLTEAIKLRFPQHRPNLTASPLDRELESHAAFVEECRGQTVRRVGDTEKLTDYLAGTHRHILALAAPAGAGKSTLLASWLDELGAPAEGTYVAYRFLGRSAASSRVGALLRSLLEELKEVAGLHSEDLPEAENKLRELWPKVLQQCGAKRRLVCVLDGLDQLETGLADLSWLPQVLPAGVQVVVSFRTDAEGGESLRARWEEDARISLVPLDRGWDVTSRRRLVDHFLERYLKRLDDHLVMRLLAKDGTGNPLFLSVLLHELRVFGSFDNLAGKIDEDFGASPAEAFDAVLRRLESDPAHSPLAPAEAVPRIMAYLGYSRWGLPPEALALLVRRDLELSDDEEGATQANDTVHLYLHQLRPYLVYRGRRVCFRHACFLEAAQRRYTSPGVAGEKVLHRSRAAWLRALLDLCDDYSNLEGPALRYALESRMGHALELGEVERVLDVVQDFNYSFQRLEMLGGKETQVVAAELRRVLEMPLASVRGLVRTWSDFWTHWGPLMMRQGDDIRPEMQFLQHAYAHGVHSPVSRGAELWLESVGSPRPWLRARMRPEHGGTTACRLVIEPGGGNVRAACLSQGEEHLFTAHEDGAVRQFDARDGKLLHLFQRGDSPVSFLALAGRPQRLVAVHTDGQCEVWAPETQDLVVGFAIGKGASDVVATSDGRRLVSAHDDHKLRVWDLVTGNCERELVGHTYRMLRLLALDNRTVVSGGGDKTLRVWNIETGEELRVLGDHENWIRAMHLSGTGKLYSQALGGRVWVWEPKSGHLVASLGVRGELVGAGPNDEVVMRSGNRLNHYAIAPVAFLGSAPGEEPPGLRLGGRSAKVTFDDLSVRIWDAGRGGSLGQDREDEIMEVASVALSVPEGKLLAGGSQKIERGFVLKPEHFLVFDLDDPQVRHVSQTADSALLCVRDAGHGKALTSSNNGRIRCWNSSNATLTWESDEPLMFSSFVAPFRGGRAVSFGLDMRLRIWDVETGECLRTLTEDLLSASNDVTRHGDLLACLPVGAKDKQVRVSDLLTGQAEYQIQISGVSAIGPGPKNQQSRFKQVCVDAAGAWAVLVGEDGTACVRDLPGQRNGLHIKLPPQSKVALSPDSLTLVAATKEPALRVYELLSGTCLGVWTLEQSVRSVDVQWQHVASSAGDVRARVLQVMPAGRWQAEGDGLRKRLVAEVRTLLDRQEEWQAALVGRRAVGLCGPDPELLELLFRATRRLPIGMRSAHLASLGEWNVARRRAACGLVEAAHEALAQRSRLGALTLCLDAIDTDRKAEGILPLLEALSGPLAEDRPDIAAIAARWRLRLGQGESAALVRAKELVAEWGSLPVGTALELAREILRFEPHEDAAVNCLRETALEPTGQRGHEIAVSALEVLRDMHLDAPEYRQALGQAYLERHRAPGVSAVCDLDRAARSFKALLKLWPGSTEGLSSLLECGFERFKWGDENEGAELWRFVLVETQRGPEYLKRMGIAGAELVRLFLAGELGNLNPPGVLAAARLLDELGFTYLAVQLCEAILERQADFREANSFLAALQRKRSRETASNGASPVAVEAEGDVDESGVGAEMSEVDQLLDALARLKQNRKARTVRANETIEKVVRDKGPGGDEALARFATEELDDGDPVERAIKGVMEAQRAFGRGDLARGSQLLAKSKETLSRQPDRRGLLGQTHTFEAVALLDAGEHDGALAACAEAELCLRHDPDRRSLLRCLLNRAKALVALNRQEEASAALVECVELAREEEADDPLVESLCMAADLHIKGRRYLKAVTAGDEALAVARRLKADRWLMFAQLYRGIANHGLARRSALIEALAAYDEALELANKLGETIVRMNIEVNLAGIPEHLKEALRRPRG